MQILTNSPKNLFFFYCRGRIPAMAIPENTYIFYCSFVARFERLYAVTTLTDFVLRDRRGLRE